MYKFFYWVTVACGFSLVLLGAFYAVYEITSDRNIFGCLMIDDGVNGGSCDLVGLERYYYVLTGVLIVAFVAIFMMGIAKLVDHSKTASRKGVK